MYSGSDGRTLTGTPALLFYWSSKILWPLFAFAIRKKKDSNQLKVLETWHPQQELKSKAFPIEVNYSLSHDTEVPALGMGSHMLIHRGKALLSLEFLDQELQRSFPSHFWGMLQAHRLMTLSWFPTDSPLPAFYLFCHFCSLHISQTHSFKR